MSQTIDTPSYTIELSDGSIRPMTVKELAIRLEQLMSADKGIAEMPVGLSVDSRSFSDYELFVAKCDLLLRNWGSVVIVSGGARGADALAKQYAVDRGYCYMEFPADWDTYGRRAGYIRNRAMHEYISTHENRGVIAFWDGKSRGTRQSFSLAGSYSNPLRVVHVPVA